MFVFLNKGIISSLIIRETFQYVNDAFLLETPLVDENIK